ncbi:Archaellum protein G, flagellin of FlaG/FlaF family [Halalkaliarchaeum sp. AArc-CO]|uniref:flagellar protein G n=1 Tax=Halalkaliarchaeum sp. AArc-CO TaxID=2866381 RepID=UPI00217E62F9|nr:flagellar protein G [Halalkaliarchaeum sp. AArc-CO]UWG52251.1 Archaellum protein G, flagellin of FlaG/FlaF family [Halalkaliarchaeum sp. AArc-CO]
MASVSISHMVIFIASLVIAAGVVGTMVTGVDRVNTALEDNSLDASEQLRTDITVISDSGSEVYDPNDETLTLLVKNTGTQPLPSDGTNLDVLVNGQYVLPDDLETEVVNGPNDAWSRSEVLRLDIQTGLEEGDHRVHLTINGEKETFQFRHVE